MRISTLFALATTAAALAAQTPLNPIAYPADTVRAGSGNLAPFGFSTNGNVDEARWQQLIPAHHLPCAGAMIHGLAVNCQSSNATVTYTSLIITLSETTATSLGGSFSGNLPTPVTVLNATNLSVAWAVNRWVDVAFTTPFAYSGNGANLVVSIQKVYDRVTNPVPGVVTHQTTGSPHRTDLVPTRYAFSAFGLGGSTTDTPAFSTNSVLSMRLLCHGQATATLRSVTQPAGREYSLGTLAEHVVWGASGTAWATFLDTAVRPPFSAPFFQGQLYVTPSLMIANGVTASGSSAFNLPLPTNASAVGTYWTLQTATVSPTALTIEASNVVDFFITN